MANFADDGAHAAHLDVAGNPLQLPLGTEHEVDDGFGQSPLSGVTALSNPVEDAVGDSEKSLLDVVFDLLCQSQQCECRTYSDIDDFAGIPSNSEVQVISDGINGHTELFFCSRCENQYFQLLLRKDVSEDCDSLLEFLEDGDYEFQCTVSEIIILLICFLPTTIPIFMEGYSVEDGFVQNKGRAMTVLSESLSELGDLESVNDSEYHLQTIRERFRVAALFMTTMADLDDISPKEYVTRAESLVYRTWNDSCASFVAYMLVGLMHHATACDLVRNAVFEILSTEIVIKWWDYAFDESADPQESNGHLRLLRLIYSWYVSGLGRFWLQHIVGTFAWKILWVPMIMQIGKSRDMEKLGPFLKMAVVSWQSNNLAEFDALDADVREDLRSFWPSITFERNLASSDNEYLLWTLKVILRALVSGKYFATAFGGRDDIKSHVDRLDKVEASTPTCLTVRSRGEVLLSDDLLYYLISPVLLERPGTVQAVEISCKCLEYMANSNKTRRDITDNKRSSPSPVLSLHFAIIRKDGTIELHDDKDLPTEGKDKSNLTWTLAINDDIIINQLRPSDKVGVWVGTCPPSTSSSSQKPTTGRKPTTGQQEQDLPKSKLHLQSMSINIRY